MAELGEAILFRATVGKEWPPVPQPRALPLLNLHAESCGGFETTNTQEGILRVGETGLNQGEK